MQSFSLDPGNLEDELFSNVLEEIVRVLTDMSIRVWKEEDSLPSIYPSMDSRGRRKGYFTHVAITPDGSQVAASRTDHTVSVWDLLSDASPAVWDFSLLLSDGPEEPVQIRRLYFSRDGEKLALESANNFVFVFQLKHGEAPIDVYEEKSGDRFLRAFGEPYIPQQAIFDKKRILLPFPNGCRSPLAEYRNKVFDCAWDEGGRTLVTASEMERSMPAWMIDAGFERAVYHIAKMRLIDLIRKRTHTDYICWHCGSAAANRNETHCPKCGADFTACPIGCSTRPGEILSVDNEWKCSQCGMATRLAQSHRDLEESELPLSVSPEQRDWASEHDLERILDALGKVTIAYRGREIRCDRLVLLKSRGKTNEEIGREIGVPRGSVDYIWNQCRQEILAYFQYL
ncbi:hypothetical protein GF373_16205 [bacterium]|nr:hypothetical protein [bacterium]